MDGSQSHNLEKKPSGKGLVVALALGIGLVAGLTWWCSQKKPHDAPESKVSAKEVPVKTSNDLPTAAAPKAKTVSPATDVVKQEKEALPAGISADPMDAFAWDGKKQGMHIMCMCQDIHGRLWVGTEGNGAWCWDPGRALKELQAEQAWAQSKGETVAPVGPSQSAKKDARPIKLYGWSQFTRVTTGGKPEEHGPVLTTGTSDVNSLGDNCVYAIACDKQGRIWTGHLNHGVSVYDGRQIPFKQPEKGYEGWRNYDVLSGPLGERVFDIEVNPADGDVWMATDAGLSRYRVGSDLWSYYTRQDGLPADQVQALAFLKDGSVVAGTQCDGLGIAAPVPKEVPAAEKSKELTKTLEYPAWRQVTTPDNSYDLPKTPVGIGLPSNLINDLLVTRDGTLWVATTTGIAKSQDNGISWTFLRGEDWDEKSEGLVSPPSKQESTIARQLVPPKPQSLLLEDYSTSLGEDAVGNIWIGHWRRGLEVITAKGERLCLGSNSEMVVAGSAYVRSIEPNVFGEAVIGCYGEGVGKKSLPVWSKTEIAMAKPTKGLLGIKMPKNAASPSIARVRKILAKDQSKTFKGLFSGDDWMTQGDWVGRYGRKHAVVCAANSPFDHVFSQGLPKLYDIKKSCGLHPNPQEKVRHWCWAAASQERRVLYSPQIAGRRPAAWDDHAEVYSYEKDGPDLWVNFTVPPGISRLTLYFMNYDGQEGNNRLRDYLMQLYAGPSGNEAVLDKARVVDWHGGVYKSFVVSEPGIYRIRVSRNHSFNVMVAGAFIDRYCGPKDPSEYNSPNSLIPMFGNVHYEPLALKNKIDWMWVGDGQRWGRLATERLATAPLLCRYVIKSQADADVQGVVRWRNCIWTEADRIIFDEIMIKGYEGLKQNRPLFSGEEWSRHSASYKNNFSANVPKKDNP